MGDSLSDSPGPRSQASDRDSDGDARLLAESQLIRLQEQLEALAKENSHLRAQVDGVARISAQLDDVHRQNRALGAAARDLRAENDSISQRLDIALRANAELAQKLEAERAGASAQRQEDHGRFHRELSKARKQAKAEAAALCADLQAAQAAAAELRVERKLASAKTEKVVRQAGQFFNATFATIDDLIAHFAQPELPAPALTALTTLTAPPPAEPRDPSPDPRKAAALRAKVRAASAAIKALEGQLAQLQREKSELEQRFAQELRDAAAKHRHEAQDQALANVDLTHQVRALQGRIDSLTKELALRKRPEAIPVPAGLPVPISEPLRKPGKPAKDPALAELREQLGELNAQLRSTKAQRESLLERLRDLEAHNQELESACQQTKTKLEGVALVHKETVADLDLVRKALHQKESQKEKSDKLKLRRELKAQKAEVARLQGTLESQIAQIHALTLAKNESDRVNAAQATQITELKRAAEQADAQLQRLQAELSHTDQELKLRQPARIDDFLPHTAWLSTEFETDLNSQLAKIVANPALQATGRLHHIYYAIHGYYMKLLVVRDKALDDAYAEKSAVSSTVNDFLVNLTIGLALDPINLQEFIAQKAGGKLAAIVSNLKTERDDIKRANDQVGAIIRHFQEIFEFEQTADPTLILQQFSGLRETFGQQCEAIHERSRKYHELTKAFKTLHKKLENETAEFQSQTAALNGDVVTLRATVEDLGTANSALRKELQTAQRECRELQQSSENAQLQSRETHDSELLLLRQAHESVEAHLREELAQCQQKLSEFCDALEAQTETTRKFKQTVSAQKALLAQKDEELATVQAEAEEQQKQLLKRLEGEKEHLVETHNSIVVDLRERSDEQRADIEKLTAALAEAEKRVKEGKAVIIDLKRTNLKLERDFDALQKRTERDQKLGEANSRAALLKVQSDYANKLEEQRAAWGSERHQLLSFIADAFKQFFSLHDSIDERAAKQAIAKAKQEIAALAESDAAIRRIVGAAPTQRTDDAVAQAFIRRIN